MSTTETFADLIVKRDAAALAYDRAETAHFRRGTGETHRALEDARTERRKASDAADAFERAASKTV
jgi:inhibitor of KinA sporulation pathway (predicted exonuclease)